MCISTWGLIVAADEDELQKSTGELGIKCHNEMRMKYEQFYREKGYKWGCRLNLELQNKHLRTQQPLKAKTSKVYR